MNYDYKAIEKKWQSVWDEKNAFAAKQDFSLPKYYALVEFPYPSGQGLHVGHPRPYTALDIVSRKKRMQGYNVLFPMGWDAFGLPTENYAIKNKIHPKLVTERNVARFKSQLRSLGLSFDWSREINTTDPQYYKWTQWIFIQLFKKGLAYKKEVAVNFCTSCKVVLANEEVVNGVCERCQSEVIRKVKSQWMLKITEYADRLVSDLAGLDYIERVKTQQINWIGKSHGAEIDFQTTAGDKLRVYTTRCDTLFGATYMVIAPEHACVEKWRSIISNYAEVEKYKLEAAKKSEFERTELVKDKTGVELKGVRAINPVTGREIPIFISDYVLAGYGTGAIMAVPAHDERDWAFAKKFGLPIIEVVEGGDVDKAAYTDVETGKLVNSGFLNGMEVEDAKAAMIKHLEDKGIGAARTNFKLRDWVFSRQRYWGEPIPLVECPECGWVPIPESELPLELPEVESYEPTETGESPLSSMSDWVNCKCPKCGRAAKRETDTMPQWAGSSWYFLRYCDPHNDSELASQEALKYWMPVDWYNGGMEHVTRHMIYSRFWHRFLYDIGVVPVEEPYAKRTAQGLILGPDGEKMSKSKGNVVDPNDVVAEYGADVLRVYILFMGDYASAAPWSESSVKGCKRFLDRIAGMTDIVKGVGVTPKLEIPFHKTIKKVSEDIEDMKFNTAIAAMMALVNEIYDVGSLTVDEFKTLIALLCPFAPHITEELWESLGEKQFLSLSAWPEYIEEKTKDNEIEIAVQICGKVKSTIAIAVDATKEDVLRLAKADEKISALLDGKQIVKEIYIPGKIVNIVAK